VNKTAWLSVGSRHITILLISLLTGLANPNQAAVITGYVSNRSDNSYLESATIKGVDSPFGAITDRRGEYIVTGVPAGEWRFEVSFIGFETVEKTITIFSESDTVTTHFVLNPKTFILDEVVYTATRSRQYLKDVPVTTELVRRKEIEQRGANTAADALETEIGINLKSDFSGQGITLQGISSDKVLVLLDGNRIIGRVNGSLDLDQISASNIERIEVVKGAVSTLYGSEAIGGVVNIISRQPSYPFSLSLDLNGGGWFPNPGVTNKDGLGLKSVNYSPSLSLGMKRGAFSGLGSLGFTSNGIVDLDPTTHHTEGMFGVNRLNSSVRLGYQYTPSISMTTAGSFYNEEKNWFEDGKLVTAPTFYSDDELNRRWDATASVTYTPNWQEQSDIKAYVSSNYHRWSKTPVGYTLMTDYSRNREQFVELSGTSVKQISDNHLLTAGADMYWWSIEALSRMRGSGDELFISEYSKTIKAWDIYAQNEWRPVEAWTFLPGLRYEQHDIYGTNLSPRLSVMWELHDALRVRGSAGKGYRAPGSNELFYVFNHASAGYIVKGNPNLKPETSENYNLCLEYTYSDRTAASVNLFYNNLHDLIFYDLEETTPDYLTGIFRYGNIVSAWTAGVEIKKSSQIGKHLHLDASYGYLVSRNRNTGKQLVGQPAHTARWEVGYTINATVLKVWGQYTDSSPYLSIWDTNALSSAEMTHPYQLWNATVSHTVTDGLVAYIKGENLFDYTHARYGPRAGRTLSLGVRWDYHKE